MEKDIIIEPLLSKRADLVGRIEQARAELKGLVTTLDRLDDTIRLFDAEFVSPPAKPYPPRGMSSRGEITPLVLGALRTAKEPLSVRQVTLAVLQGRRLPSDDLPLMETMTRRVSLTLRRMRLKGAVTGMHDGRQIWWRLA